MCGSLGHDAKHGNIWGETCLELFLEICWVADSNLNTVTMSSIKIFFGCVLTMGYLKGFIPKNMFIPKKTQHG